MMTWNSNPFSQNHHHNSPYHISSNKRPSSNKGPPPNKRPLPCHNVKQAPLSNKHPPSPLIFLHSRNTSTSMPVPLNEKYTFLIYSPGLTVYYHIYFKEKPVSIATLFITFLSFNYSSASVQGNSSSYFYLNVLAEVLYVCYLFF